MQKTSRAAYNSALGLRHGTLDIICRKVVSLEIWLRLWEGRNERSQATSGTATRDFRLRAET